MFLFVNLLLKKLMTARPAATPQFTLMQTCRADRDLWARPSTWRPTAASGDSGESECVPATPPPLPQPSIITYWEIYHYFFDADYSRLRRTQSGGFQPADPEAGPFKRGGLRATAGPRLTRTPESSACSGYSSASICSRVIFPLNDGGQRQWWIWMCLFQGHECSVRSVD